MTDIDNFMTDEQIYKLALADWLKELSRLWKAAGKEIDAAQLNEYRRELEDVPLGILEKAVSRCIRENVYNNVPTVGKVWQAVFKEFGWERRFVLEKIEEWREMEWQKMVVRFEDAAQTN
jgi:hypothetical protein